MRTYTVPVTGAGVVTRWGLLPEAVASTVTEESSKASSRTAVDAKVSVAVTGVPAAGTAKKSSLPAQAVPDVVVPASTGIARAIVSLGSKPSSMQGGGGAQAAELWKAGTAAAMRRSRLQSAAAAGPGGPAGPAGPAGP